jgi:hypothetical protein
MFPARDGLQAGLAQRQQFADDIHGVLEVRCLCRMLQAPLLCVDVLLILPVAWLSRIGGGTSGHAVSPR